MKTRLSLLTAVLFVCVHTYGQSPGKPIDDVRTFVTQHYIHGLPYEQAKQYGPAYLPVLFQMLKDPALAPFWQNVVVTIGYIGGTSSTKPLLQFIQQQEGEISASKFRAVLSVFQALGHIAQHGDQESLKVLSEFNDLNSWKSKNLKFSYNYYKNEALSEVLSRQAIQGLGISGRPEAYKILVQMNARKDLRKDWTDNVSEAIMLNKRVKTYGAEKTFGKEKQP